MKTSSKLRRLQRARKLRRQRSAFFMIMMVVVMMMAHSAFSKYNDGNEETQVISVVVQPGDTMWTIAAEYMPEDADIREFMYEIAANNGIKDCNIVSGQTIYVPVAQS